MRFFGTYAYLADEKAFAAFLVRLLQAAFWHSEAVLAYLSRYTHRVVISNSHLIAADANRAFKVKDYHAAQNESGIGIGHYGLSLGFTAKSSAWHASSQTHYSL